MKALKCVFSEIRVATLTDAAVEIDAPVRAAVVEVRNVGRGDVLADYDNGLPQIDVGRVYSATCNLLKY